MMFKLGLIVNPLAGIGGSVALKGSDGADTVQQALALGAVPRAGERARQALDVLAGLAFECYTYPAEMGEQAALEAGIRPQVLGAIKTGQTCAEDTRRAALDLVAAGVDLILFAGGDGTARDLHSAIDARVPVLGVPAGVKIHSGVYAITPVAAGQVVAMLIAGDLVSLREQEVRDIDEQAFRQGQVRARYYGELLVPEEGRFVQQTKSGGKEVEVLVLDDIAADSIENMDPGVCYVMGSGTTVQAVMAQMGLANTLLGVDLVRDGALLGSDLSAAQLLEQIADQPFRILVTVIGGQGHIIGRGNQQLSTELLRRAGRDNLLVIATKTKLKQLEGRPLVIDSGDPALDKEWSGLIRVVTGYHDAVLYPVADY
ncbi:MAG: putative polyphosphate/ATP-dependent NAD kinase [Motiliproteus sp.]|jgi:predicted polyphosphate/ATP-dependent NAD kinase